MNGHYIRELSIDDLYDKTLGYWPEAAQGSTDEYKKAVLRLVQERLKFYGELPTLTSFFFSEPDPNKVLKLYAEDKQLKDKATKDHAEQLKAVINELSDSDFTEEDIRIRLNGLLESLGTKPGMLFSVVRIAITGSQSSPELFGSLAVLGKETSLKLMNQAAAGLEK